MLKPHMVVLLNQNILHGELLPSRPAHHRFRDLDALLIRQRNRQRERFPWSQRGDHLRDATRYLGLGRDRRRT